MMWIYRSLYSKRSCKGLVDYICSLLCYWVLTFQSKHGVCRSLVMSGLCACRNRQWEECVSAQPRQRSIEAARGPAGVTAQLHSQVLWSLKHHLCVALTFPHYCCVEIRDIYSPWCIASIRLIPWSYNRFFFGSLLSHEIMCLIS